MAVLDHSMINADSLTAAPQRWLGGLGSASHPLRAANIDSENVALFHRATAPPSRGYGY
jgi:hypothetical protein